MVAAACLALGLGGCSVNESGNGGQSGAKGSDGNAVIEAIMARRSVRNFKMREVPRELLQTIMTAGINAPSAMNKQDWEVRMVTNQELLAELSAGMLESEMGARMKERLGGRNAFSNAPAVAFVADELGSGEPGSFAEIDCGLLGENMLIAAQSLGLGTVIQASPAAMLNSCPDAERLLGRLGFSEGYVLRYIILIGYPDEAPDAKPRDAGKARFVD